MAALADFDVVVAMRERTPFPRTTLERLPRLDLLVTTGMRNAAIDLEAARDNGVDRVRHRRRRGVRRRRADLDAAAGRGQAARRRAHQHPRGTLAVDDRHLAGGADAGRRRPRSARRTRCCLRQGLRDGRGRLERQPHRRALRRDGGTSRRRPRLTAGRVGLRLLAPRAQRPLPRPDRSARAGPDEADGLAGQHQSRTPLRRGRTARGGAHRGSSAAPRSTSTARSHCPRTTRCAPSPTSSRPRTSAMSPPRPTPSATREAVEDVLAFLDGSPVRLLT